MSRASSRASTRKLAGGLDESVSVGPVGFLVEDAPGEVDSLSVD
jgi:hypothetical protein